jgi:SpoVK/Ycf46/Vps4 family AAA+-type ATPase
MEIGLPDDAGREQIWKIHTAKVNDPFIELFNIKISSS